MLIADFHKQLENRENKTIEWLQPDSLNKVTPPGVYLYCPHDNYREWIDTVFRNYLRTQHEIFLVLPTSVCKTQVFHSKVVNHAEIGFICGPIINQGCRYDTRPKILCHYKPLPPKVALVDFA